MQSELAKKTVEFFLKRSLGVVPSRAGVDPYRKLIERERGNNVIDVESGG